MANPRVRERRAEQRTLRNPPFDARIKTLLGPGSDFKLKRGKLVNMETNRGGAYWVLHFLYNPSTIQVGHAVVEDTLPDYEHSKYDLSSFLGETNSSLQWSLLFDRTYEVWDRGLINTPAGKYGVYTDVRALYGLLGMVEQSPITGIDLIKRPMLNTPAQVYFGGEGSLSYFGRINSIDITYTNWTKKMVPFRCVINIGMAIYPKVPQNMRVGQPEETRDRAPAGGRSGATKRRTVPDYNRLQVGPW